MYNIRKQEFVCVDFINISEFSRSYIVLSREPLGMGRHLFLFWCLLRIKQCPYIKNLIIISVISIA